MIGVSRKWSAFVRMSVVAPLPIVKACRPVLRVSFLADATSMYFHGSVKGFLVYC